MSKSKVLFKCCNNCGGKEFISQMNQYDVYLFEDGELVFQDSELIDEKVELYCRYCGTKLKEKEVYALIRD